MTPTNQKNPTKHTPGPWKISHDMPSKSYEIYANDLSEHADEGDQLHIAEYITEANARLIAAAPDMLEALEAARSDLWRLQLDHSETPSRTVEAKINAAIAKATS